MLVAGYTVTWRDKRLETLPGSNQFIAFDIKLCNWWITAQWRRVRDVEKNDSWVLEWERDSEGFMRITQFCNCQPNLGKREKQSNEWTKDGYSKSNVTHPDMIGSQFTESSTEHEPLGWRFPHAASSFRTPFRYDGSPTETSRI
jgi:hypothetical protein